MCIRDRVYVGQVFGNVPGDGLVTILPLQDILTAIEEVESFFGNAPKVYDDFYSNPVSYTHLQLWIQ